MKLLLFFTFGLFAKTCVHAQPAQQPFAFYVRNLEANESARSELAQLRAAFATDAKDVRLGHAAGGRLNPLLNTRSGKVTTGVAHYSGPNGSIDSCRVVAGVTKDGFDAFVKQEKRAKPEVKYEADNVISLGRAPYAENGVHFETGTTTIKYTDGIVVWGPNFVRDLDVAPLRPIIQQAEQYHSGLVINADVATQLIRKRMFLTYAAQWQVLMQVKDGEGPAAAELRIELYRLFSEGYERFTKDLVSFQSSVRFPVEGNAYRWHTQITFEKDSPTARVLGQLQSGRRFRHRPMPESALEVTVDCAPPEIVQPLVRGLTGVLLPGFNTTSKFDEFLNKGLLSAQIHHVDTPDRQSAFLCSVRGNLLPESAMENRLTGRIPFTSQYDGVEIFWDARQRDGFFEAVIGTSATEIDRVTPERGEQNVVPLRPLFQCKIDLHRLTQTASRHELISMIDILAQNYVEAMVHRDPMNRLLLKKGRMVDELPNLVDRIGEEGDWTLRAMINCSRNGRHVDIDLSMGRELYGFLSSIVLRSRAAVKTFRDE